MIPRRAWTCIASALICVCTPASAQERQTVLSGIFSNVSRHPETGDLDGLEIEIHADQAKPYALVVYCEGWCDEFHRIPIALNGNRFHLRFSERLADSSGQPASIDRYLIDGQVTGSALVGTFQMNTFQMDGKPVHFRLRRRARRLGLTVAKAAPSE